MSSLPDARYRAETGETSYDVVLEGGTLRVNDRPVAFEIAEQEDGYLLVHLDGRPVGAVLERQPGSDSLRVTLRGRDLEVQVKDERDLLLERFGMDSDASAADLEVRAPMPGLVLSVAVEAGQSVSAGDPLLVLEAMKMENELNAPTDGVIAEVQAVPGTPVGKGDLLLSFEA